MVYIVKKKDLSNKISKYLNDIKPDIVVITGHDAFNKFNNKYKNSDYFIDAIKKVEIMKNLMIN